jgi:hypothetical protein
LENNMTNAQRQKRFRDKRKARIADLEAAAETTLTIAADPKRLGARIGITAVLHTWGTCT